MTFAVIWTGPKDHVYNCYFFLIKTKETNKNTLSFHVKISGFTAFIFPDRVQLRVSPVPSVLI